MLIKGFHRVSRPEMRFHAWLRCRFKSHHLFYAPGKCNLQHFFAIIKASPTPPNRAQGGSTGSILGHGGACRYPNEAGGFKTPPEMECRKQGFEPRNHLTINI